MKKSLALLFALTATPAFALDDIDKDALADTQALLTDEQALAQFTKGNPDASKALDQVKLITGGDQKQQAEVNSISSDVFADMVKSNNGDSAGIHAQLQNALKDPKAFMNKLSPAQQKRIRDLASQIDAKNGKAAADVKKPAETQGRKDEAKAMK